MTNKRKLIVALSAILILFLAGLLIKFFFFSGRSPSRLLGENYRQQLVVRDLPDAASVLSISFDRRGDETVKDVTFRAADGFLYTKEYKDWSPLEGIIRWVPAGTGSDWIQSRAISRWIGEIVNLELPKDFQKVLNIDISYSSSGERTKNLVYFSTDGRVLAKEYREGLLDRHFEGYLEVIPKKQ